MVKGSPPPSARRLIANKSTSLKTTPFSASRVIASHSAAELLADQPHKYYYYYVECLPYSIWQTNGLKFSCMDRKRIRITTTLLSKLGLGLRQGSGGGCNCMQASVSVREVSSRLVRATESTAVSVLRR